MSWEPGREEARPAGRAERSQQESVHRTRSYGWRGDPGKTASVCARVRVCARVWLRLGE